MCIYWINKNKRKKTDQNILLTFPIQCSCFVVQLRYEKRTFFLQTSYLHNHKAPLVSGNKTFNWLFRISYQRQKNFFLYSIKDLPQQVFEMWNLVTHPPPPPSLNFRSPFKSSLLPGPTPIILVWHFWSNIFRDHP